MKIGLLFGSYNPVHLGHLLLATRIREYAELNEVWLVVSPHNPHKNEDEIIDGTHRLEMVKLAVNNHAYLKVCDTEFSLSRPSYTHLTLKELTRLFNEHTFSVIIGEDILEKFNTWMEADWIKNNFEILIYNRTNKQGIINHSLPVIHLPLIDISATEIRKRILERKTIRYFVPEIVEQYILQNNLFI